MRALRSRRCARRRLVRGLGRPIDAQWCRGAGRSARVRGCRDASIHRAHRGPERRDDGSDAPNGRTATCGARASERGTTCGCGAPTSERTATSARVDAVIRGTKLAPALCVVAWLPWIGCGASMPDAAKARAMYDESKPLLDRIDRLVARAVASMPGADTSGFACARIESDVCAQARGEMELAFRAARRAFARQTLPSVAKGTNVLGISAVLVRDRVSRRELGVLSPASPGEATGSVPVERGFRVGSRRVGYGLYQTSWRRGGGPQHGDGEFHPGITVSWEQTRGNAVVSLRVVLLLDGWRRPDDWDRDLPEPS